MSAPLKPELCKDGTELLRPYHQGQLDFFCAAYAVINALVLTHAINLSTARRLLAETLRKVSANPVAWQAVLYNETDFYWLVEYMLAEHCRDGRLALQVLRPEGVGFYLRPPAHEQADLRLASMYKDNSPVKRQPCTLHLQDLWTVLQHWLPLDAAPLPILAETGQNTLSTEEAKLAPSAPAALMGKRALILRFNRYLPYADFPFVSHWSTGRAFCKDELRLFDATADPTAVHSIDLNACVLSPQQLTPQKLLHLEPESIFLLERTGPAFR